MTFIVRVVAGSELVTMVVYIAGNSHVCHIPEAAYIHDAAEVVIEI